LFEYLKRGKEYEKNPPYHMIWKSRKERKKKIKGRLSMELKKEERSIISCAK
jgi:hypothetical protein